MLSILGWFWFAYFSIGIFVLMEGIVGAWDTMDHHIIIKILGTVIAVAIWPVAFMN